ncbi:MAG: cardiolipin synthase [Saprospiraceae bacterium]|nr:cardiolipin synthase [Saprospiraceae bacterium]
MIYTIAISLYALLISGLILNLLLSGARPTKTLAWIMVILFMPGLGILLYVALGVNRRKYKFHRLTSNQAIEQHLQQARHFFDNPQALQDQYDADIGDHLQLTKLNLKSSGLWATGGNSLKILNDGQDTFDAIVEALNGAKSFIHLQYYIYEEGDLADQLAAIFEEKSKEGVEIRFLYDGVGSLSLSRAYLQRLRSAGIKVYCFFPLRFGKISTHVNYRNHRKILVVDGKSGFTGGINVSDKYIKGDPNLGIWHDLHLKIDGPAVTGLNGIFTLDWLIASGEEHLLSAKYFPEVTPVGNSTVQIVAAGPDSAFPAIQYQYLSMINNARQYLYIANPYVIPGESILQALKASALSGVDVRILLPEKSDSKFVNWCTRSYFEELMESGVKNIPLSTGFPP